MRTFRKSSLVVPSFFFLACVAGVIVHAQDSATTNNSSLILNPERVAAFESVEQQSTVDPSTLPFGGRGITYFSAQCPWWPALPANIFDLPVWNMGDGTYLINDFGIDYSAFDSSNDSTFSVSRGFLVQFDGGGGDFSPYDLTQEQSGIPYLLINSLGTNQALITVLNDQGAQTYELWYTPVLTNPTWTLLTNGLSGQTNFLVNLGPYPTGFYRALWDTNSIPVWQLADPNNPGAGILTVFIDNPTNGAVIQ